MQLQAVIIAIKSANTAKMSTERLNSSRNLDIQFQFVSLITIIYGGKPEGLPWGY